MLQTNLKRPLTLALGVIGLSLVVGIGGATLLGRALEAQAQEVIAARVAIARSSTLAPRLAELRAQEPQAAAYERVLGLLLPTQEQLLEVPRVLEQLGRSYDVTAKFQYQGSEPGVGAVSALPFTIVANGTPGNLALYLREVEIRHPRYTISIGSVDLTASQAQPEAQLSIAGSIYYQ